MNIDSFYPLTDAPTVSS